MVVYLACVVCGMSLEESLVAATINGAASLGRSSTHGSLEVGKCADMLLVEAPSWEHLLYRLGCHQSLIKWVVKAGKVVYQSQLLERLPLSTEGLRLEFAKFRLQI
ncbi:hypothetical protein MRX96_012623 [Rhipicephalus microplus]